MIERAIQIGEYLIPHARAAFASMGADPHVEDARFLLRWLEQYQESEFSKRAAFEATRARFRRVEALEPALALLTGQGYIRERVESHRGRGRPSQRYGINPRIAGSG